MKDLITVATYTMKDMLKRKSFLISMAIILIMIIVGFNVPNIIKKLQGDDKGFDEKVLLVDAENIFENTLDGLNNLELGYQFEVENKMMTTEQIKEKLEKDEINSAIVIHKQENQIELEYVVENLSAFQTEPTRLVDVLSKMYTNIQVGKLNLSQEEIMQMNPVFEMSVTQTSENTASGNITAIMLLSLVLFYAIYFCAYQVSTSIVTEKTSKIIETLVTTTTPKTIVLGKTIGIGIVGLIQISLMILTSIISAKLFLEEGILESVLDLSNITPMLAILTIVYFLLGYALYALLYALTGSTVSKPEDVQSANGPVAILAVVGFYLAYFSMMNPGSEINVFSSIFPLSSAFSMPFRVMMGTATTSQILLSIAVLVISILVIAKISIQIYSSAVFHSGSKMNIKEMLKAYKNKNH